MIDAEEVTVPAGTYKTFRLCRNDQLPGCRRRSPSGMLPTWALSSNYAGLVFTADRLTRATNHPSRFDPRRWEPRMPWSTRTSIPITLRGWYLPTHERRHLIVLVHGMWSSWLEMASLGRDLNRKDSTCCSSTSGGMARAIPSRLSLGRRERADIRAVMIWAEFRRVQR